MIRKILAGIYVLSLFAFAPAGKGAGYLDIQAPFSDTTDAEDSIADNAVVLNDPKAAFRKLLYVSNASGLDGVELNPHAASFVDNYIDKFGKKVEALRNSSQRHFTLMDEILEQHGIPHELKYLAVIESNLKLNARSGAGAVGPWQFMPATARNMGLKVNGKVDERRDFTKSTHAASRYLNKLYDIYGDWLLVIAAYNGGPGAVNSAIRRSGSRDFWTLQKYLPTESRNHVKKFIATHYLLEGQGGIATVTKAEAQGLARVASSATEAPAGQGIAISGRYNAAIVARHLSMDIAAFNKLNPNFDRQVAANGKYELRLPEDKLNLFQEKKTIILDESMALLLNPSTSTGSL